MLSYVSDKSPLGGSQIQKKTKQLIVIIGHALNDHPQQGGETYLQHLWFTLRMAGRFSYVSFAILVHGFVPFLFTTTASTHMAEIFQIMKVRARQQQQPAPMQAAIYVGEAI
jgi:hypothetical protein